MSKLILQTLNPRVSGVDRRFDFSHKFPGVLMLLVQGLHFENHTKTVKHYLDVNCYYHSLSISTIISFKFNTDCDISFGISHFPLWKEFLNDYLPIYPPHNKEVIKGRWAVLYFQPQSCSLLEWNEPKEIEWHKDALQSFINRHYCLMCVWLILNGYWEPTMY